MEALPKKKRKVGKRQDSEGKGKALAQLPRAIEHKPSQRGSETQADKSRPRVTEQKSSEAKTAAVEELESLFSSARAAKRKQPTQPPATASVKAPEVDGSKDDLFGSKARAARKRTKEGYRIFSEEELSINKGGDTEQCPFDCSCCF